MTRFEVEKDFLDRYEVQQACDQTILEYWIPAEDLPELNRYIVGRIELQLGRELTPDRGLCGAAVRAVAVRKLEKEVVFFDDDRRAWVHLTWSGQRGRSDRWPNYTMTGPRS